MDSFDTRILNLLQTGDNLTTAEIAEQVGLTPPPTWRRIKRLRDEGYISKTVTVLNPKKLGLGVCVYATIKLSAHGRENVDLFRESIREFDEVVECYVLLGSIDVLLKIVATDIDQYHNIFFGKLSKIPGVQEVNSSVVIDEVKHTHAVPLSNS